MNINRQVYLGKNLFRQPLKKVKGKLVNLNGEEYYKISDFTGLTPFLITVVSHSDHWMFVSSRGGLTCGRRNADTALFPYITDDKIHDAGPNTGPMTIILVQRKGKTFFWQPFEEKYRGIYNTEQNIYKATSGDTLMFEEINNDLKSAFTYKWMTSDKFGLIRESTLINLTDDEDIRYEWIDGLQNIMPFGVNRNMQATMSTLVDAYKKTELADKAGMVIYSLSSVPVDRAEPSEALYANVVWQCGLDDPVILLSTDQFDSFITGGDIIQENTIKGRRGNFFVKAGMDIHAHQHKSWRIIADLGLGHDAIIELKHSFHLPGMKMQVEEDILKGREMLKQLVACADGMQCTADRMRTSRHYSDTLFNIMRGGVFSRDYRIMKDDFLSFVKQWNRPVYEKNSKFLTSIASQEDYPGLQNRIRQLNVIDLERLSLEYLPLTFSRRHGDPSRPWNVFFIDPVRDDGSEIFFYQGNWRDIFQNWEALSLSFPEFNESFIVKFLNASTADGYNPYRITREGFDWEVPDANDPWSNIGYWGDHQVVYLLRLMELSRRFHPGRLEELLNRDMFVYADLPYRIRRYNLLIRDPHNTIDYISDHEEIIRQRTTTIGVDGKLYVNRQGELVRINLTEKLLVNLLTRLSNFVAGGGIWMNTQRPEWNDANNALAGFGLSMVTVYYLRRFLIFIRQLWQDCKPESFSISEEVADMLRGFSGMLAKCNPVLAMSIDDDIRKDILDAFGTMGDKYREQVYAGLSGNRISISGEELAAFYDRYLQYIDYTIRENRRADGLYHAYNLIHFSDHGYTVEYLYEMLEGQVAVLSSGYLGAAESADLLDALRASKMYRDDQKSYMLYPEKELPFFLDKNRIPAESVSDIPFLQKELKTKSQKYIIVDRDDHFHFNGSFRNAAELRKKLEKEEGLDKQEIDALCNLFIEVFNHRQFTGRSGTFFKYEGLGCIYWHMVSKLFLAVQELWTGNAHECADILNTERIYAHYCALRDGQGFRKTPAEYGSFPTDPYSHTPRFAGVQQPGMTGQVKEDIITRFGDLGVIIDHGEISFIPALLEFDEFMQEKRLWEYYSQGKKQTLTIGKNELAFTICNVPVIYHITDKEGLTVCMSDGSLLKFKGHKVNAEISRKIFHRNGEVSKVFVDVNKHIIKNADG